MLNKKRVLIVEDDPIIALDLSRILKSAGMIVVGPAITLRDAEQLARMKRMLLCWMFGSKSATPSRLRAIFAPKVSPSSFRPATRVRSAVLSQSLLCWPNPFLLTSWLLPSAIYWAFPLS